MEFQKKTLGNGTEIYVLCSESCATTYVEMDFYSRKDFTEGKKTLASLITMEGSKKYSSSSEISLASDREYCTIGGHSYSIGDVHAVSFHIDALTKESLTSGRNVLENCLGLLHEVIANPLSDGSGFKGDLFKKKKEELLLGLKRNKLDKGNVARQHFLEAFIGDSVFVCPASGTEEEVIALQNEDVYSYYHNMIEKNNRRIFVSTNLSAEYIFSCLEKEFSSLPVCNDGIIVSEPPKKEPKVAGVEEHSNFDQCVVYVGFPCISKIDHSQIDACSLLNAYIGGYSSARLFKEIRTKRNMAYGAYSTLDPILGMIYGKTGVDIKNKDEAVEIMIKEINNAATGKISKAGFAEAKRFIINYYLSSLHVKSKKLEAIEHAVLKGEEERLKHYENRFKDVTYEDVINAASLIDASSPLVYVLLQGEKDGN